MTKGKIYSYLLVFFQFIFIGLLFLNSHLLHNFICLIIFIFGIILGAWSVLSMRKSKLSIIPDVSKNASLVKDGPYKYIRHPMYSSVLVACLGMLLSNINLVNIIFYFLLIFDLYSKISFEEKLLLKSFSNYKEYRLNTKKIIPFVY